MSAGRSAGGPRVLAIAVKVKGHSFLHAKCTRLSRGLAPQLSFAKMKPLASTAVRLREWLMIAQRLAVYTQFKEAIYWFHV